MITEVKHLRLAAGRVLQQLIIDRERVAQRSAETGRPDPLESVTGHSALDEAITTTRDIIRCIDELDGRAPAPAAAAPAAAAVPAIAAPTPSVHVAAPAVAPALGHVRR